MILSFKLKIAPKQFVYVINRAIRLISFLFCWFFFLHESLIYYNRWHIVAHIVAERVVQTEPAVQSSITIMKINNQPCDTHPKYITLQSRNRFESARWLHININNISGSQEGISYKMHKKNRSKIIENWNR